ncbi:MAG: YggT family protein [Actinobacteria bacterium]|nr:YggT family protein [Actinomycetota bacterium]
MAILIDFVNNLFTVYILIVLIRVLLSWVPVTPIRRGPRAVYQFVHDTTNAFLGVFRRVIPPLGPVDLSPMAAIIVLYIGRDLVVRLLLNLT